MWPSSSRFLTRLRAGEDHIDDRRPERVIAISRIVLAAAALLAVYIDPPEPAHFTNVVRLMLFGYLVYGVLIWVRLRWRQLGPRVIVVLHLIDIVFPVVVAFFSGGPRSPFFLFFFFAIVWSAFRWGSVESIATAAATMLMLIGETLLMGFTGRGLNGSAIESAELNRIFLRCVYLAMLGAMLGMLGEREKEWRAEQGLINRVLKAIRAERGFGETMHFVVREFLKLYRGTRAIAVIQAVATGRFYQYELYRDRPNEHPSFIEIFGEEGRLRMLPDRPPAFYVLGTPDEAKDTHWISLDQTGQVSHSQYRSPARYFGYGLNESALCIGFQFGNEWSGRLMLIGARLGPKREDELKFAEKLMRGIGPAVYSVYLVRRLRNRISAVERARVARELHDGAIQSLIAVEMQVDVLRRQAAENSDRLANDLERIQQLLREQVLEMRELMQQLKPAEVSPEQFLDFVGNTIERFRRDTGINATLQSEVREVDLTPQQCRELGRILQEALVNVRKHSGAGNVMVDLNRRNGNLVLTIEDDGRGFGFTGRLNSEQLTAARLGPTIIQERVRSMSGELEIESVPGKGARLQVALPRKGNRAHG